MRSSLFELQPTVAMAAGGAILLLAWTAAGPDLRALPEIVGFCALLAALGAATIARALAPASVYAVLAAAFAVGVGMALDVLDWPLRTFEDAALIFGLAIVLAGSAFIAGLRMRAGRTILLGAGAVGAAAIASLAWPALDHARLEPSWAAPGLTALLMACAAAVLARRVEDKSADLGLGLWIAGTAELIFLTVFASVPHQAAPAAQASVALVLALLAARLRWRGLALASLAGGLVAFASMLRPAFMADTLDGRLPPWILAAVTVAAAGQLYAGGRVVRAQTGATRESEALDTWALLVALLGAFLLIHVLATGGAHAAGLGQLLEAGLRTDLVLAAGLLLALRATEADGPIARWRLLATIAVGVLHGVLWQLLAFNPWWGVGEPPLGPPVFNSLALTYLAPAALLTLTVRRGLRGALVWPRLALGFAFLFALTWAVLEIRYDFHGRALAQGPMGRAEACGYALLGLVSAAALFRLRRRSAGRAQARTAYLAAAAPPYAVLALAVAAVVFGWWASPWWGPRPEPLRTAWEGLLLFGGYAAGVAATAWLARLAEGGDWRWLPPAGLSVSVGALFVLITLLVRWSFRGADMRASVAHAGVETWTFSAVWAVYGLLILIAGGLRKSLTLRWLGLIGLLGTLAKVLIFDMERLDGMTRAASFLAVGALLIFGALAARRLNAGAALLLRRR